tara:strand:- start:213 stop:542 length:330 start_codon:yes stop_codon:yes gene_type:complete
MPTPLKNKKKIELLFRLGEKKSSELLECRYLSSSENRGELRFVVVAPIKNFPRAVDRNKIKRRLRAVVHKKTSLLVGSGFNWFLFIYLKKEIVSSEAIEDAFASLFSSL